MPTNIIKTTVNWMTVHVMTRMSLFFRYLFLDVLSDRDRERTHIFSSFFFKRLTQRHGQRGVEADMADKT